MPVVVYTTRVCSFCTRAKNLLNQRGIPFQEIVLANDDEAAWQALYKKSPMKTVPQIFQGDRLIGGYTELAALDQVDQLKSLLK